MADMTLSWPRLTWPALALRHAGPRSRKISATSSAGRGTRARALSGRLGLLELARDVIERTHDLADRLGGDAGIERRGIEPGVAEQHLDHSDIDVLFQKMGGKAVPECVRRYPLVDPGHVGSRMTGAIELARGERIDGVLPGKQPPLWPARLAPSPQQLEQ